MKLSEFKKLEESIKEVDFHTSFKNINKVMFVLSIFGHISSIFLAYFLVNKIIGGAITDNPVLVGISTVILLSGLELLKREIFDKFSLQFIKLKNLFSSDVLPLFLVSLGIVSLSFYASIKGAQEFSSKSKEIDTKTELTLDTLESNLRKNSSLEISKLKSESDTFDLKINQCLQKRQEISQIQNLSRRDKNQQLRTIQETESFYKNLKSERKKQIDSLTIKTEREIEKNKNKLQSKSKEKKSENEDNSFFFVLISTIIELMILFGVYFNEYYRFRSYSEFKSKVDKDPNYQKWYNYNGVLELLFNEDTKINDKLPSAKMIFDLSKVAGIPILSKDIVDIMKLFNSLGVIRSAGNSKYILKDKETSKEILKKHFKIQ
jgi:hypothetical protein